MQTCKEVKEVKEGDEVEEAFKGVSGWSDSGREDGQARAQAKLRAQLVVRNAMNYTLSSQYKYSPTGVKLGVMGAGHDSPIYPSAVVERFHIDLETRNFDTQRVFMSINSIETESLIPLLLVMGDVDEFEELNYKRMRKAKYILSKIEEEHEAQCLLAAINPRHTPCASLVYYEANKREQLLLIDSITKLQDAVASYSAAITERLYMLEHVTG